jgi:hypothetical protein
VWSVSCAIDTLPHTPQTQYTQQVSPWGSREEPQLAEIIRSQALVIKYPTSHEQYRFTKNRTIHSPHDSLSGPTHTWPALDHHLLCQRFDHFILCHPRLKSPGLRNCEHPPLMRFSTLSKPSHPEPPPRHRSTFLQMPHTYTSNNAHLYSPSPSQKFLSSITNHANMRFPPLSQPTYPPRVKNPLRQKQ